MSGRTKFKTSQMLMLVDIITAWGGYRKPAEGIPKPRECFGVWPTRCALFLALLSLPNEALLIARWLTTPMMMYSAPMYESSLSLIR